VAPLHVRGGARLASGDVLLGGDSLVVALRDDFPVSDGHSPVVPRRRGASQPDLTLLANIAALIGRWTGALPLSAWAAASPA
jgi:hypothetical protein